MPGVNGSDGHDSVSGKDVDVDAAPADVAATGLPAAAGGDVAAAAAANDDGAAAADAGDTAAAADAAAAEADAEAGGPVAGDPSGHPLDQGGCFVCKRNDQQDLILLCDGCDGEYHTFCVSPPLRKIPDSEWFCDECKADGKGVPKPDPTSK